ncbi:hypothetical protein C2857_001373 [Epichloe festucae Fl1]|uniref:Large ribosomal subunit protein mL49 n=1 Tax=Epichloe festucae (strain Fl1) TaxID=877507 RepID=A0A7S9PRS4_EPIFF|nr:hypothetical protein C2857_001373 [Epichloe festucae Fl1]
MSRHIPRVVYQGQRYLSSSNLSHATKKLPIFQLSFLASSRCLSTATTKATRSYTPISRVPTPPPTKTTDELASGPYIVRRTPSAQLPVYKQLKSGGNRVVVLIKKVDGDRKKLLEDMVESLGVSQDEIRINPTTQNLELKGDYYEKAKSWLLARGF